jgi:hypothetical protein
MIIYHSSTLVSKGATIQTYKKHQLWLTGYLTKSDINLKISTCLYNPVLLATSWYLKILMEIKYLITVKFIMQEATNTQNMFGVY